MTRVRFFAVWETDGRTLMPLLAATALFEAERQRFGIADLASVVPTPEYGSNIGSNSPVDWWMLVMLALNGLIMVSIMLMSVKCRKQPIAVRDLGRNDNDDGDTV